MLAVIADVHGNFEALRKAVDTLDSLVADEVVVLGDLIEGSLEHEDKVCIGNKCIDLIRERGYRCVKGNHDQWIAMFYKNPDRRKPYERNPKCTTLDDNIRNYLKELPAEITVGPYLFAHSFPPGSYRFNGNLEEAKEALDIMVNDYPSIRACFVGHNHHQECFFVDRNTGEFGEHRLQEFTLEKDKRYMINPGALGVGEDQGNCLVLDPDKATVSRKKLW